MGILTSAIFFSSPIMKLNCFSTDKTDDKNNTENQNSENVEDRNPLHLRKYSINTNITNKMSEVNEMNVLFYFFF